jgi:hypothetical protein
MINAHLNVNSVITYISFKQKSFFENCFYWVRKDTLLPLHSSENLSKERKPFGEVKTIEAFAFVCE